MLTEYCRAMHYHKKMLEKDAIDTAVEELVSAHEQIITCLLDVITKNRYVSMEKKNTYNLYLCCNFYCFELENCLMIIFYAHLKIYRN